MNETGNDPGFTRRIGVFFLFIGLVALIIFFSTDWIHDPTPGFLCWGAVAAGLGGLLMLRGRGSTAQESRRFRMFRGSKPKKEKQQ